MEDENNPHEIEIIVVDKQISCLEIIDLIIENSYEEAMIWNAQQFRFDGMLTYHDLICMMIEKFKQIFQINNKSNTQSFNSVNEEFEEEQSFDNFLSQFDILNIPITQQMKQQFFNSLQHYQLNKYILQSTNNDQGQKLLYSVKLEAKLHEACLIMNQQNIHRIIVKDNTSNMVVGIMNYKDILLLLIRNLTNEQNEETKIYEYPIQYFFNSQEKQQQFSNNKVKSIFMKKSTLECFDAMINKFHISSIPVVDENNKYLGLIYQRDIVFMWKNKNIEILGKPVIEFLQFVTEEKQKFKLTSVYFPIFFELNESVRSIVEKCVLAPANRLININQLGEVQHFLTLSDIIQHYLKEDTIIY